MGDFDTTKDYKLAAAILFPVALVGLTCNLIVIYFIKWMPSLNNSFGSLTLSQAIVDSIHQLLFVIYVAPTILLQNSVMYYVSAHFGFAILSAYQICCYLHVCISLNRFAAICAPFIYRKLFSRSTTIKLIISCWVLGIANMTYMLNFVDCIFHLPRSSWIFTFKETAPCYAVKWYVDFTLNSISVIIVAILDVSSILRLQTLKLKQSDMLSAERRRQQRNLVYQASCQGILFITELLTYFVVSGYARNKWQAYALTTVAWCLVNGMDGLIVLVCNRDFRRQFKQLFDSRLGARVGTAAPPRAFAYERRLSR